MGEREHFDAIVIGSGFGGSVSAYVLASAGLDVCLLERGKAYPPGSFPRTPREMAGNFWDPSKGLHGLFDLWAFKGIDAIVSAGLGGGSLIYANVLLRKDPNWFVDGDPDRGELWPWPVTRDDLDPHYDRVEEVLLPRTYPYSASTPKSVAFGRAAAGAGFRAWEPPLAVTFHDRHGNAVLGEPILNADGSRPWNLHERTRSTCRLCSECDIGCNYGSKNTLDFNYLSAFAQLPTAQIRTRAEVKWFRPARGGYEVEYVDHTQAREGVPRPRSATVETTTITTDRLVLAAGTIGSTYLLLRNARSFPGLSKTLGTKFSGNGDFLGIIRAARRGRHLSDEQRIFEPSRGTVITNTIHSLDALDPGGIGRGFYIQEGGYPAFLSWLMEVASVGTVSRAVRLAAHRLIARIRRDPRTQVGADFSALFGAGTRSAGAMPLLGMGRDTPDGTMTLDRKDRFLAVDWTSDTSEEYLDGVSTAMKAMADALGAKFSTSPLWHLGHMLITVHPLGGCPMGHDRTDGVVDSFGRVFGYPGFVIADGAVMPGPVGPNPSLTIATLAHRFAQELASPTS